jgi:plasmid rolling circle replication initiator protein Rep
LKASLDVLTKGWNEFGRARKVTPIVKGWFRALEITYNESSDTFHPHIHAIILVEKSYFKGKDYKTTEQWVQLWQKSARLDYTPVCDIRKTRTVKGKRKEVAEVAKYALKDSDFLRAKEPELTDKLVGALSTALHGRRMVAFGGVMKKIAEQLFSTDKPENGDLIHIDEEETIRKDIATTLISFRWNFGFANYVRNK